MFCFCKFQFKIYTTCKTGPILLIFPSQFNSYTGFQVFANIFTSTLRVFKNHSHKLPNFSRPNSDLEVLIKSKGRL